MSIRVWSYIALLLSALGLTIGAAHLLELPPKMHYDGPLYTAVNSTLYRYYGIVGGAVQSLLPAWKSRKRHAFRLILFGSLFLALSLLHWGVLVQPVNAEWSQALKKSPASITASYLRLRPRWEWGHVAAFAAWFSGFCLLLFAVVGEIKPPTRTMSQ